ncbi:MAG: hypothetical protein J5658_04020 [Prevotella sp.]|nr:hypothetical protein [Prevotella sp.]
MDTYGYISHSSQDKQDGYGAYDLPRVWKALELVYDLCGTKLFRGAMSHYGNLTSYVATALRKRGIVTYNGKASHPEWAWVANSKPTKELARNVLIDIREMLETARLKKKEKKERMRNSPENMDAMREAINKLPPIPVEDSTKYFEPASSCDTEVEVGLTKSDTKLPTEIVKKLGDRFLVQVLRNRGYNVICTKTIEL